MTTRTANKNHINEILERGRLVGYSVENMARIMPVVLEFQERYDVRMTCEPQQEGYFDVFGEPEGYDDLFGIHVSAKQEREEICRIIDLHGCWVVRSEYRCPVCNQWKLADSVGMCMGYVDPTDWACNEYVVDLMVSAIEQAKKAGEHHGE